MATMIAVTELGCVYGVPEEWKQRAPIANLPEGATHVRFRFRNNAFVHLFVRHKHGFTAYIPEFCEGMWWCDFEMSQGTNRRLAQ